MILALLMEDLLLTNYVKKIFLVSNNEAFNRLYEFLGQEYINQRLQKMGYGDAQILHRLSIAASEDENRHTNPVSFYNAFGKLLYKQPMQASQLKYVSRNDSLGKAYYNNDGQLINQPMNFSKKNRICLADLHNILRTVLFPNSVPVNQRFNLSNEDYQFVYQYMSQLSGGNKLSAVRFRKLLGCIWKAFILWQ